MPRHISRSMLQSIQGGPGRRRRGHPGRFHHSCLPPLFPQQHLSNFSSYQIFPAAEQQTTSTEQFLLHNLTSSLTLQSIALNCRQALRETLDLDFECWPVGRVVHYPQIRTQCLTLSPTTPHSSPPPGHPTQPPTWCGHCSRSGHLIYDATHLPWWLITRGLLTMMMMMMNNCLADHTRPTDEKDDGDQLPGWSHQAKVITRVWPSQGLTTPADKFRANCTIEIGDAIHFSLGALFQCHINSAV